MLQKARKLTADSEFCERRRKTFVTEGNNSFFAGSNIPGKKSCDTFRTNANYEAFTLSVLSAVSMYFIHKKGGGHGGI